MGSDIVTGGSFIESAAACARWLTFGVEIGMKASSSPTKEVTIVFAVAELL